MDKHFQRVCHLVVMDIAQEFKTLVVSDTGKMSAYLTKGEVAYFIRSVLVVSGYRQIQIDLPTLIESRQPRSSDRFRNATYSKKMRFRINL